MLCCAVQEMFQRVYGVRSSSNNNLWLRKKLIEGGWVVGYGEAWQLYC